MVRIFWALAFFALPSISIAEFHNNIETFDGTTKDLATWREYGTSRQDNELFMFSGSGYITRDVQIGVGGFVDAEISNHSNSGSLFVGLCDSAINPVSYALLDRSDDFPRYDARMYTPLGFDSGVVRDGNTSPVPTYRLRVDWLNDTDILFRLLTIDGYEMGGTTLTVAGLPSAMHIWLGTGYSGYAGAIFDNVRIGGNVIPEPSIVSAIFLGIGISAMRRRKKAMGYANHHSLACFRGSVAAMISLTPL